MDMNLSKLWEIVKNRGSWQAIVHGVTKSWTRLRDWTITTTTGAESSPHSAHRAGPREGGDKAGSFLTHTGEEQRSWQVQWKSENHSDSLWPHGPYSPWNAPGQNNGVGSHSLLQGIFPTQRSNPGPLDCTQILCHLSHQRSPVRSSKGLGYWDHSKVTSFICISCLESVIVTHNSEHTN